MVGTGALSWFMKKIIGHDQLDGEVEDIRQEDEEVVMPQTSQKGLSPSGC